MIYLWDQWSIIYESTEILLDSTQAKKVLNTILKKKKISYKDKNRLIDQVIKCLKLISYDEPIFIEGWTWLKTNLDYYVPDEWFQMDKVNNWNSLSNRELSDEYLKNISKINSNSEIISPIEGNIKCSGFINIENNNKIIINYEIYSLEQELDKCGIKINNDYEYIFISSNQCTNKTILAPFNSKIRKIRKINGLDKGVFGYYPSLVLELENNKYGFSNEINPFYMILISSRSLDEIELNNKTDDRIEKSSIIGSFNLSSRGCLLLIPKKYNKICVDNQFLINGYPLYV